jgi:hypothetical protein
VAGFQVDIKVADAVEAARGRFTYLASSAFPQTVQFSLNRVVLDGVNKFRKALPIALRHHNEYTLKAVGYELDRQRLATVDRLDDMKSAAYIRRD